MGKGNLTCSCSSLPVHARIRSYQLICTCLCLAMRTVVLISTLYTPLKHREDLPAVLYEPMTCKSSCHAILNPYWYVSSSHYSNASHHFLAKSISEANYGSACSTCLATLSRSTIKTSNTNLPAELLPKYTTIEYTLSCPAQVPPIFLFVV